MDASAVLGQETTREARHLRHIHLTAPDGGHVVHRFVFDVAHPLATDHEISVAERVVALFESQFKLERHDLAAAGFNALIDAGGEALRHERRPGYGYRYEYGYGYGSVRIDLTAPINRLIASDSLTPYELQAILVLIGRAASVHEISLHDLVRHLNAPTECPMLSPDAKRVLPQLADARGAAWIACIRWGLRPGSLPDRPRFAMDDALYERGFIKSLQRLVEWQLSDAVGQRVWHDQFLVKLLSRLLLACPSFPALTELLDVTWVLSEADELGQYTGSILSMRTDASLPGTVRHQLVQSVLNAATRVLSALELMHLPSAYRQHVALQDAVRAAAANMSTWNAKQPAEPAQILETISLLEFT